MDDGRGILDRLREGIGSWTGSRDRSITVVSGLPRSGTSMMMQALERGGLDPLTDERREADEDNPEGYYELERVKGLPDGDDAWLADARGRAVKIVSALLGHLPADHSYEVVFMRRDVDEVLDSQRRMLERQAGGPDSVDDAVLRREFLDHVAEVQAWADERPHVRWLEVDYNRVVEDPTGQFERVAAFLEADVDVAAMAQVVDPNLYRQRR